MSEHSLAKPDRRRRPSIRSLAALTTVTGLAVTAAVSIPSGAASASPYGSPGGGRGGQVSPIVGQPAPTAAVPTVSGPISGDVPEYPAGNDGVDKATLAAAGYQEREFFISGKATAYKYTETPGVDGNWKVAVDPGSDANYTTRLFVLTPINPRRFNGTVITEWNNVTGGYDATPDLKFAHNTMFRNGNAYVGVSAQYVGVQAGKLNDPARYGALNHPGDSYSYDIYSQAGMAVWRDPKILGGLRPVAQIADGESQSAGRMEIYVDAVAPLVNVFNGFMVHSRGGSTFPLQEPSAPATVVGPSGPVNLTSDGNAGRSLQQGPPYAQSRTDLLTPVLYAMTESDVFSPPDGGIDYAPATQLNSAGFRLWEMAGTSHIDNYVGFITRSDTGDATSAQKTFDAMLNPPKSGNQTGVFTFDCNQPINTGEHTYVFSAAEQQLERWVRTGGVRGGIAAAAPPLFAGQRPGLPTGSRAQRDANGIILGGVRNPSVDAPVAALSGQANSPGFGCLLLGTTTTFSASKLKSLYPTHDAFVRAWTQSAIRQATQGYLTLPDAFRLIQAARSSSV